MPEEMPVGVRDVLNGAARLFHRRRASPQMKQQFDERIASIKRQIARCENIASLEGHHGWIAIQSDITDKLEAVKYNMDKPDLTDLALRVNNVTRISLEEFSRIVDRAKDQLTGLYAALAKAEKERAEYQFD